MDKKKTDELLESNYDGIQEYDNDLPGWWLGLFYLTIGVGFVYVLYTHFAGTPTDIETVATEMKALRAVQQASAPAVTTESEETLVATISNAARVQKGKTIFDARCAPCHGANAEGTVGPNLTDEFWIHGGTAVKIKTVIENGVPDKGMLAWKSLLPAEDLTDVLSYVWSVRNTNHPGKAPQGTKE